VLQVKVRFACLLALSLFKCLVAFAPITYKTKDLQKLELLHGLYLWGHAQSEGKDILEKVKLNKMLQRIKIFLNGLKTPKNDYYQMSSWKCRTNSCHNMWLNLKLPIIDAVAIPQSFEDIRVRSQ